MTKKTTLLKTSKSFTAAKQFAVQIFTKETRNSFKLINFKNIYITIFKTF